MFTFNARSADATVIGVATYTIANTIAMGGKPEFAICDNNGLIYVNIEDTHEIAVIGALCISVLLSLLATPAVYFLLLRPRKKD